MRLLVADDKIQSVLDALQNLLGSQPSTRIVVLSVEIALPKPSEDERKEEDEAAATREALYAGVEKNADWISILSYWYSCLPPWLQSG